MKRATAAPIAVYGRRLLPRAERAACLRRARRILRACGVAGTVGVAFVNDLEMRVLNRAWRHKDATTDVLSFSMQQGEALLGDALLQQQALGDVVISIDTARRQARAMAHELSVEIAVLVAHGVCHLAGLDHERSAHDARVQLACERTLLAIAGVDVGAALIARHS